jgi:microcystin-dependent protein
MEFLGEIWLFIGTNAPAGWVFCDGQLLNITQYSALFQLIGTTYGGDGIHYFKVPDLRGRIPIGAGQGSGLPGYLLGETGGTEKNTLLEGNLPAHNHTNPVLGLAVSSEDGHKTSPAGNYPAVNGSPLYSAIADSVMAPNVGQTGGSPTVAVNNMQPYQAISYIMCCNGIYPSI